MTHGVESDEERSFVLEEEKNGRAVAGGSQVPGRRDRSGLRC